MTAPRGLHLHVDCASGAAGDMMLGALIDLGVPVDVIGTALDAIGAGRDRLRVTRVVKAGIGAVDVKVDTGGTLAGIAPHAHLGHAHEHEHEHDHGHDDHGHAHDHGQDHDHGGHGHAHAHDHGGHGHRHRHGHSGAHAHAHPHYYYTDIRNRIADAPLNEGTRRLALDIFDRIARAEAKLHGTTVDEVAFHEVGAIDSVVDVVGTAAALDWLAPARVTCASVAMGHGTVRCAHGVLPVPAPAALEVLREAGGVMADGGVARELCTPTGAAILAAVVTAWTPTPAGRPAAIGWGAGDADLADRPNVIRLIALAPAAAAELRGATAGTGESDDAIWQIDANVDDMSPELCAPAADAIFAAGALDVWWSPITMKKGRPALLLSALATAETRAAVVAAILRETTTIGVRYSPRQRAVLARRTVVVETRYGAIPIKVAEDGGTLRNAAPEYEDCAAAAQRHGVPVKLVFAAALAAFDRSQPE